MISRFHFSSRMSGFVVTSVLAAGVVVSACGGGNPSGGFGNAGTGSGSGGGGGGGGGDADGGGGLGLGGGLGGGSSGGGVNLADAACASSTSRGQQAPLDMYIMLDQSGSMSEQVAGNTSKWAAVSGALNTFVGGTNTTGIAVGIQYFGLPPGGSGTTPACPTTCTQTSDCGATGGPCVVGFCVGCLASGGGGGADSCTASDYATPDVEIAPLPGVGPAITASIAKHGPTTSTPTSAALQGAVDHAQAWAKSHTSDVVIAVLATDGDPTECDTTLSDINAIAAAGVSGTPKVLTFVIGVGASTTALNGIAAAGGTTAAFLVDTTMNVNQQFLDALNKIRGTALGCNYTIPLPTSGNVNYAEINVQYTPSGGGAPVVIPNVSGAAQCPATGDAWYYDNPTAPTQIVLCPGTCKTVEANQGGDVQILVGCATIAK